MFNVDVPPNLQEEVTPQDDTPELIEETIPDVTAEESEPDNESNEEVEAPQEISEQAKGLTPDESEAKSLGWKEKTDYSGDDWVPAKQWLRVHKMGKELSYLRKQNEEVTKHNKLFAAKFENLDKKEILSLNDQRLAAYRAGDIEEGQRIEAKMAEFSPQKEIPPEDTKAEEDIPPKKITPDELPPAEKSFLERNRFWLERKDETTREAMDFCLFRFDKIKRDNPGLDDFEVLDKVEKAIKQNYPQLFTNPKKYEAPRVMNNSGKTTDTKNQPSKLTPQQKMILDGLNKSAPLGKNGKREIMTEKEYLSYLN